MYFRRSLYMLVLTGQWLKSRYGEPIFVDFDEEHWQNERFPFVQLEPIGPINRHRTPLLRFMREWGGRLEMGSEANPEGSTANNPRIVIFSFDAAIDGALKVYLT